MRAIYKALTSKKLQLLPSAQQAIVQKYVEDFVHGVYRTVSPYPPVPPPPNRYVRTNNLFRSWSIRSSSPGGSISVRLINTARYARFVQGLEQVWYHERTGWKILMDYEDRARYISGLQQLYRQFRIDGA